MWKKSFNISGMISKKSVEFIVIQFVKNRCNELAKNLIK